MMWQHFFLNYNGARTNIFTIFQQQQIFERFGLFYGDSVTSMDKVYCGSSCFG